jgi:hypothetical protein
MPNINSEIFCLSCQDPTYILVVGSNLRGAHGRGAALHAKKYHGAKAGVGEGLSGMTYLLPTKDEKIKTLSLIRIMKHVRTFIEFAELHEELKFALTAVGTGLAGYSAKDIAPFFKNTPKNVVVPESFRVWL